MTERFKTLVDVQERACKTYAHKPLFGYKVDGPYQSMSYGEFGEAVRRFASVLVRLGVCAGDKVAIISNNRVEWAIAAYATYRLSGQFVPMYEAQRLEDWRFILRDCEAKVLLVSKQAIYDRTVCLRDELPALEHVLCFDAPASHEDAYLGHMERVANTVLQGKMPQPHDVAGLIYTSGTTGEPKGVVLTHANIVSNINAIRQIFPISSEDVSCSFLPWAHSFGQTVELHLLMSYGVTIGIAQGVDTLMENFLELRPTILMAVPRIFNRIYDGLQKRMAEENPVRRMLFEHAVKVASERRERRQRGERTLALEAQVKVFDRLIFSKIRERFGGRLRYVVSGGAALSREVAEFIDNIGILVFEGYGLTETSPIATANCPDARRLGTVGRAIPGVEIYICDEDGNVLPDGKEGEIVVVGPNVMQGYHNRPEQTAAVIFELDGMRAFRTGDLGCKSKDGFVTITGREKEQYKLENGKYVVPTPIEEQLKLSGFINQLFVYGDNRPYNVCLVVPDVVAAQKFLGTDEPLESLARDRRLHDKIGQELATLGEGLRGYERPTRWALLREEFTVENGLMTPKLSVRRNAVEKRHRDLLESLYER